MKQKKKFEKKNQNSRLKNNPQFSIFLQKFQGLVLGWIGWIDTKGIYVGQPIWSSGCLTLS